MKTITKLLTTLLLPIIGIMLLNACNDNDKDNVNKQEKEFIGSAIITLHDGQKIEFEATINTGITAFGSKLSIGLSNSRNGMLLTLLMYSGGPIEEPGTYDGTITLRQQNYDDILTEEYRSNYYKDADTGEEGNCALAITSISEKRVQGTFSGTLYSESGEKADISEGKFDITIDKEF